MWKESNGYLIGAYDFPDFFKAVVFIDKISLLCDKLQHLPKWQQSLHRVRVEIMVEKTGRKESAQELQQQIEDIYCNI
jgi:pterin-4a-carbinolamine dehydratase